MLNLRTRKVCGVTVATKDPLVPDGGLLFRCEPSRPT